MSQIGGMGGGEGGLVEIVFAVLPVDLALV